MRTVTRWLPLILLAGCAGVDQESWLISEQKEMELGAQFHQQLLQEMPAFQGDAKVSAYVNALGQELVQKSSRPSLPFKFTVVQSDDVNAFAVLGGYVYVTTALLKSASSGAEIASVVAHEIGHVTARHGVRAMETYLITNGLTNLLAGMTSKELGDLAAQAIQAGDVLLFSKDQEREADSLGVQYALATGYNAWGMVDFFAFLNTLQPSSGSGIDSTLGELFSTHPPTQERIQTVQDKLEGQGISRDQADLRWESSTPWTQVLPLL